MNEIMPIALQMLLALVAGSLLGAIYFGGLWWTVRKSLASPRAALWVFASLLMRMSIVLTGFYFVANTHWLRLVACLVGFIAARQMIIWLTRLSPSVASIATHEASHAP